MASRRFAAAVVYAAAFAQGLTLVSFPASSALLKAMHGLTDAQYGAIFLPQVTAAVAGAVAGGAVAGRAGLRLLLVLALLANAGSQALLAGSAALPPGLVYPAILCGTALLGLGFGVAGAPLNSYPGRLFPARAGPALVALHSSLGLGLMAGPLLASALMGAWLAFPLSLLALCALLAIAAGALPPAREAPAAPRAARGGAAASPEFWLLAAIAVVYAFAEGTFANWAVIFLADAKGLPPETAGAALSVFWGALVGGRLAVWALIARVPARAVWVTLPCLMLAAFLAIPQANGAAAALAAFALAGFACSAFFPLTVALTSERFPAQVAWVSSMLTAALMLGVGLGSFAVGALRETLGLEQLYRLSAAYPALILMLIGAAWVLGPRTRVARPA